MAQAIQLVTFDAGGTLIFPHPSVGEVYAEVLGDHGFSFDPQVLEERFRAVFKRLTSTPRVGPGALDDKALWRTAVRETLGKACPPEPAFARVFEDLYQTFASARRWRLNAHLPEVLYRLRERGYRLAILSNADARFRQVFAEMGLAELFEAMFISGELGFEKPDVRIFRHVEQATGVPAAAILHVGDSPAHDQAGAEAAGWSCFLVRPGDPTLADLPLLSP